MVLLMWSADEIQAFVTLWAEGSVQDQLISIVTNEKIKISTDMTQTGCNLTPKQR